MIVLTVFGNISFFFKFKHPHSKMIKKTWSSTRRSCGMSLFGKIVCRFFIFYSNYGAWQNRQGPSFPKHEFTKQSTMKLASLIFTSWAKLRSLKISCFFIALLKSSDFNGFYHIFSQIWCDNLPIRNFIRFSDFFRIFPDFPQIFKFLWFWQYFFTGIMFYLSNMIW